MKIKMKMRSLCILLCFVMLVLSVPISAAAATSINSVAIYNVYAPRAGAKPTVTPSVTTEGVFIHGVDWYDNTAGRYLESNDTFIEGHIYKAQVWAEATDGYEFRHTDSKTPNITATVNGKSATVSKAYEYSAWAMVVISYTFSACPDSTIKSLEIELSGITKEGNVLCAEENAYIPFEIQSASEDISLYPELNLNRYYPNGFRWSNMTSDVLQYSGDRFKGGKEYYVHIAIKPNGTKFADNITVTVNGKQATLKTKGAGYAEVGVEVTCFGKIGGVDIRPVVILPKDGNCPDTGVTYAYPQCKNIDYAAINGWYDLESGKKMSYDDKFVGGKKYRVELYCMAAYPYKFDRDASDKMKYSPQITGIDVDSYSFGYDDYRGREFICLSLTFTAITPDHTCTEGDWQCDADGHRRFCVICNRALAGGAHWGGEATCASGKLCEVCGYEYTKPTENHTPDTTKWTACGSLYHAHLCKLCGAHCDPQDHKPGPAATDDKPQKCTVCGYVITPAKNHKHTIKEVAATKPTCTHTGNSSYYICTGCEQVFADKEGKTELTDSFLLPAAGHAVLDKWYYDGEYHWKVCADCDEPLPETKVRHEPEDGKCTVCNYEATASDGLTNDADTQDTKDPEPEKKKALLPVIFGAALVAAVIIKKKKKA